MSRVNLTSNVRKVAAEFAASAKRLPEDMGFLLGTAVESAATNIATRGIPRPAEVKPNHAYGMLTKGGKVQKFSGVAPVQRTGALKGAFDRFKAVARSMANYTRRGPGMEMLVQRARNSSSVVWRSNGSIVGILENSPVSEHAKHIIPGMSPWKWPTSKWAGKPRRFVSKRWTPVLGLIRRAFANYGKQIPTVHKNQRGARPRVSKLTTR